VQEGGALLDASGPVLADPMSLFFSPVGEILPSTPLESETAKFQPKITAIGRRHPVTALLPGENNGQPSWGSWYRQVAVSPKSNDPTDTAVVMSGLHDKPLLLLSHVGQGRVAQLTSDQIWLWSRGYDGGGPQAELLRRLAHWLMKEPALEENDLRARIDGTKLTVERVGLTPGGPDATVTAPSGATETLKLADTGTGVDSGSTQAKEIGVYKISDGKMTAFAIAGSLDSPEFRDVLTTGDKLKPVGEATGGGIHWLADDPGIDVRRVPAGRAMSGGSWVGLRANGQYTVSGVDQTPLLPPILVLLVTIAALIWGWRREGE
jgi:hypothetical protein